MFCPSGFDSARRLHLPEEFSAVFSSRMLMRGLNFTLHYLPLEAKKPARLGLVIPKRLAKKAVLRNSIKRQGREAFRLMAVELPPCDLVLKLSRPQNGEKAKNMNQRKIWRTEIDELLLRLTRERGST